MKNQMTVFCSFLSYIFIVTFCIRIQYCILSTGLFGDVLQLFLVIGNFYLKFLAYICGGPLKCGGPGSAEHVRTFLFNLALTAGKYV